MKSLLTLTTAVLLAIALASPAFAEEGGGRKGKGKRGDHGKRFERHDKNGDGALTQDEVSEKAWTRISKCDADGNGAVTKEEMRKCKGKRKGKRKGRKGGKGGKKEGSSTDS